MERRRQEQGCGEHPTESTKQSRDDKLRSAVMQQEIPSLASGTSKRGTNTQCRSRWHTQSLRVVAEWLSVIALQEFFPTVDRRPRLFGCTDDRLLMG